MQHDTVIWTVIGNKNFCSYKHKLPLNMKQTYMCRHPKNVTGLCARKSCPLANSRYATVLEENGQLYLYMKSIERAHSPARLWERIKLKENFTTALSQIDQALEFWPGWNVHKCKQRYVKLFQYIIRMRKLEMRVGDRKRIPINKKVERRDARREEKAHVAARIEGSIKRELLERLKAGTYGDIYNFAPTAYGEMLEEGEEHDEEQANRAMDGELEEADTLRNVEDFIEDEDLSADLEDFDIQYEDASAARHSAARSRAAAADDDDDDADDDDDDDDEDDSGSDGTAPTKRRKKAPAKRRVEIEFEEEVERPKQRLAASSSRTRRK